MKPTIPTPNFRIVIIRRDHKIFLLFRNELEQYQKGLSDRPHGILANKIDLENSRENLDEFVKQISENFSSQVPVFPISGKMGQNISPLLYFMREMYDSKYKTE